MARVGPVFFVKLLHRGSGGRASDYRSDSGLSACPVSGDGSRADPRNLTIEIRGSRTIALHAKRASAGVGWSINEVVAKATASLFPLTFPPLPAWL
jgi:hypothetical protein